MRELHLFAGAGGGILGGMLLGHTCVCAVEIEPYCRKVLLQRQRDKWIPKFPIWDDIRNFDGGPWRGKVDVVCGGFPCQDISIAGTRVGIDGPRSGLWKDMARIIGEVRPQFAFVENSPNITVLGLGRVIGDLASMGFCCRWGVLGGISAGMDTDGKRMWIFAATASERRKGVLQGINGFNPESSKGRASDNAYPPTIIERIQKHEICCGKPAILGELDGIPDRVDRLTAIGNAQSPDLVRLAWNTLSEGLI